LGFRSRTEVTTAAIELPPILILIAIVGRNSFGASRGIGWHLMSAAQPCQSGSMGAAQNPDKAPATGSESPWGDLGGQALDKTVWLCGLLFQL
jgi:hypothetical protein